ERDVEARGFVNHVEDATQPLSTSCHLFLLFSQGVSLPWGLAGGGGLIALPRAGSGPLRQGDERGQGVAAVARGERALEPRTTVEALDELEARLTVLEAEVLRGRDGHGLAVAHQVVREVDEVDVALVAERAHLLRDHDGAAQDGGRGPLDAVVQPD